MISNRVRLNPAVRVKSLGQGCESVPRGCPAESDEALFLLKLRLHELTLLLPLKVKAIALVRKRMASQGVTQRLELELAEQREQLKDLSQLFQDWLKLTRFITQQQPNLDSPTPRTAAPAFAQVASQQHSLSDGGRFRGDESRLYTDLIAPAHKSFPPPAQQFQPELQPPHYSRETSALALVPLTRTSAEAVAEAVERAAKNQLKTPWNLNVRSMSRNELLENLRARFSKTPNPLSPPRPSHCRRSKRSGFS
jgi:hypothetical protein